MNWINFKETNSRDLPGLLICELPPISKPALKTETITIEGKDGDITEVLGYSSYQKTVKIGLAKNYDINEIIQYFSRSGNLIFSNEPAKFYRASIFDSVNYERLVKFRTSEVKFYVQPFKYLVGEKQVTLEISDKTELEVENVGNLPSKPIVALFGKGIVTLSINNLAIFQIDIDNEFVTIDSEKEDAYKGSVLKNRFMIGEFPVLNPGTNTITWVGNLTKIEVQPKSRWL